MTNRGDHYVILVCINGLLLKCSVYVQPIIWHALNFDSGHPCLLTEIFLSHGFLVRHSR
ncbi:hypothetical protein SLEP1_g10889 [Rubroshorea leprosula]|uniref:Uncharacterized protein n=1 Tax=Rubroshorea leprosula TaxID=152421 RepID=A0AAV5IJ00_9ROSI|nr:hypothetical protein SLEP1_g10889 [Rubroshorea leprosula]